MDLPLTAATAGVFAVSLVALSLPVSLRRVRVGAVAGDGGDETLRRRIRAQGNFIEYGPLGLAVVGFAEAASPGSAAPWIVAGLLIAGRLAHAIGMLRGSTPLRAVGMLSTYLSLISGAGAIASRLLTAG